MKRLSLAMMALVVGIFALTLAILNREKCCRKLRRFRNDITWKEIHLRNTGRKKAKTLSEYWHSRAGNYYIVDRPIYLDEE